MRAMMAMLAAKGGATTKPGARSRTARTNSIERMAPVAAIAWRMVLLAIATGSATASEAGDVTAHLRAIAVEPTTSAHGLLERALTARGGAHTASAAALERASARAQHDACAFGGKEPGCGRSDPARRAGNDDDLVLELHAVSPSGFYQSGLPARGGPLDPEPAAARSGSCAKAVRRVRPCRSFAVNALGAGPGFALKGSGSGDVTCSILQ